MLQSIVHFFQSLYDPQGLQQLIAWGGPTLVCFIVFIETGLFAGFFLPGDSLLVTAGIFAATSKTTERIEKNVNRVRRLGPRLKNGGGEYSMG